MDPLRSPVRVASLLVAALAVTAVAVGGCGRQAADEDAGTRPTTAADPGTTLPVATTVPAPACDAALLRQAAESYYADARIRDEACLSTWAIATLYSSQVNDKGVVVFFGAEDRRWKLLKIVPVDGSLDTEAPEGFPRALIGAWEAKYVPPTSSTTSSSTTTTRPSTTTTTESTTTTQATTSTSTSTASTSTSTTSTSTSTTSTSMPG